jgi:acetyl/propionyl-CoA carboxylase alpha subunit
MRFNILYIFWVFLLVIAAWLMTRFTNSSQTTLFGSAETQGQILNYEYPVLIHKIYVHPGDPIRKGDTLMVLARPELDKQATLKNNEIQVNAAENHAKSQNVDKELERLKTEFTTKVNDIKSQIQLLESEEKTQAAIRFVVDKNNTGKSLLVEKINTLKNAITVEQQRYDAQTRELYQQRVAESSVSESKKNSVEQEITFLEEAKGKLVLLSPIDGYIETILAFENEIAPQYKELMKINSKKPDMVKGFLPESANVMYQLGDSVGLRSSTRPDIMTKGVLVGSTPQLVELPDRLAKLQKFKSWGREVYVKLLPTNDFFIGEKIIITIDKRS